jgi:hypothetical protein
VSDLWENGVLMTKNPLQPTEFDDDFDMDDAEDVDSDSDSVGVDDEEDIDANEEFFDELNGVLEDGGSEEWSDATDEDETGSEEDGFANGFDSSDVDENDE